MMNPPADDRLRTGKLIFLSTGALGLVLIGVLVAVDQGTPLDQLLWQLGQLLAAVALTGLVYLKRARVGQGINWLLRRLERKPFAGDERPEPESQDHRRWIRVGDGGYKLMDSDQMAAELERRDQHHRDALASVQTVAHQEQAELRNQLDLSQRARRIQQKIILRMREDGQRQADEIAQLQATPSKPNWRSALPLIEYLRATPKLPARRTRDALRSAGFEIPEGEWSDFKASVAALAPLSAVDVPQVASVSTTDAPGEGARPRTGGRKSHGRTRRTLPRAGGRK
jgi:hypothetical protein